MNQSIRLIKISDSMILKLTYQVFFKSISKLREDLDVTLHASYIIASEKLIDFHNILTSLLVLGGFVALGNSVPFVKKISEIKYGGTYLSMKLSFIYFQVFIGV